MGCGTSRADDTPLVALCRERRDLIRATADHRYALASAHASYFRSLAGVGDALHRFVHDEFAVAPSPPRSPVLTIPSSEGKSTRSKSSGSPAGATGGSASPVSPAGSHLKLSSPSGSEAGDREDRCSSASPNPNYYYMRSSSAISSIVHDDPYAAGRWPNSLYTGYYGYDYGFPPYGVQIGSPSLAPNASYYNDKLLRAEASSPPPPPQGSSWDFFNPFLDSYEQDLLGYYQGRYGAGSAISSPDSSEVRKQEGIPDLEEDTEHEPVKEVKNAKKVADQDAGISDTVPVFGKRNLSPEIESKSSSMEKESNKVRSNGEEELDAKREGVSFDEESSLVTEESEQCSVNPLSTHGTRDVMEVVDEIKERFRLAAGLGEEVAMMLQVGRLPYRSGCRIFTVIFSRILDLMAPSTSASLHPSFKRQRLSSSSTLKNKTSYTDLEMHIGMKSGDLSSTLEKLYMWEKKLYKEVKIKESSLF